MCGFASVLALDGRTVDLNVIEHMASVIAHRGPDDQGIYISGPIGFGFRRLSILDLSPAGHQPMLSDDGMVAIVFNGEIYNFKELRNELEKSGHSFHSNSDTEVLLKAYCEWGMECLKRLNGMWAFLIHDQRRGTLFGSRDRFGIKPLYRYRDRKHVLFGSEIKAIRASGLYQGTINWVVASDFLINNKLDQSKDSFFSGIDQIPPGTAFEMDLNGEVREWAYWSVDNIPRQTIINPAFEFAELFEDAVRLHMRSDVPVGVNLSGGLDSTSIICASARIREKAGAETSLLAFSFMDENFDETRYIADTIAQTSAQSIKLDTSPDKLWSKLAEVLWYHDEPVHTLTALVGYELMGLAASHGIKVLLNGQGADETIAGYPSYFREYWATLMSEGKAFGALSEIRKYCQAYGGLPWNFYLNLLKHLTLHQLSRLTAYRQLVKLRHRKLLNNNPWFSNELKCHVPDAPWHDVPYGLNDALSSAISCNPLPLYLRIEERNSMAHSIEARVPFLDYRLVELLFNLSSDWKMRGPFNKYVLREAMTDLIPDSVRMRVDKMGFPVPSNKWFSTTLYEPVMDILNSRKVCERGIYNIPKLIHAMECHRRGEVDMSTTLFNISQFEIWSEEIVSTTAVVN
ncbi:MAG: asparagine synthase (glutamine-hydrolyzing) [Methylococcales bacterium]|nr:MAG: asparagine synthase (glutamine-hydrolyzing) [Methylococcales bacterium]